MQKAAKPMASTLQDGNEAAPRPMRERLISARLITLMTIAGDSATLAYRRRLHMPESVRQILFVVGAYGSVTSKDIVVISGREKAQISRSVNALSDAGLIARTGRRGPISLSEAGSRMFQDILDVAVERNKELCRNISASEIESFLDRTRNLIDQASALFDSDGRPPAGEPAIRTSLHHPPSLVLNARLESSGQLVLPWLQSLTTYIQRSGSVVFKREIGLSNFEWRVLSQIGEYEPTTLSFLISQVSRDKSQVARTVKELHTAGLIDRRDEGRVNTSLTLTKSGARSYARMCEISIERDTFLFRDCSAGERSRYFDLVERLTDNARRMLVAEEAAEQGERGTSGSSRAPLEGRMPREEDKPGSAPAGTELAALAQENARLKMLLAEAMLENSRLKERIGQAD